jgi:hypothetical protein
MMDCVHLFFLMCEHLVNPARLVQENRCGSEGVFVSLSYQRLFPPTVEAFKVGVVLAELRDHVP